MTKIIPIDNHCVIIYGSVRNECFSYSVFIDNLQLTDFFILQTRMQCSNERGRSCRHIGNNIVCCQYNTWSGSCDNCGSTCTEFNVTHPFNHLPCCGPCMEIPPTRLPEFIEVYPGSCEFRRLERQWVCMVDPIPQQQKIQTTITIPFLQEMISPIFY